MANLEGRPHFVVPVIMGVVGVWNGSQGPLLYLAEDLEDSAPHWNGKPCVVYHPDNSGGIAGHPEVFNAAKYLFHARLDGNALKAEAWLDPERLKAVDPRVLRSVQQGRMVEVSTGLLLHHETPGGRYHGTTYNAIARDHRPDHLAILPDAVGACSIEMGRGFVLERVVLDDQRLAVLLRVVCSASHFTCQRVWWRSFLPLPPGKSSCHLPRLYLPL